MDLKSIPKSGLLGLAALAIIIVVTWLPMVDTIADADIDRGFNRALISFGIAKAMNMLISLLQSTQFNAQAMIMGFSISPGELLDPINDLVEQFSNVMLLATVAFGIQKILIAIGGNVLVKSLVSALGIATTWFVLKNRPVPNFLKNALILVILVRLAVPAATILSNGAFQLFLEPQYQASKAGLTESSAQLQVLKPSTSLPEATAPQGSAIQLSEGNWWSKTKNAVSNAVPTSPSDFMQKVDMQINGLNQRIEKIADQVTRDVTSQIVVFLLQTLFFPIGLIWVLYKIAVSLMYRPKP